VKHAERAPVSGGGVHQWCEEARAARLRVEGEVAHVEAHGVRGEVALGEDHPPGVVDVDGPLDAVGQIPADRSEIWISTALQAKGLSGASLKERTGLRFRSVGLLWERERSALSHATPCGTPTENRGKSPLVSYRTFQQPTSQVQLIRPRAAHQQKSPFYFSSGCCGMRYGDLCS
jgi:hypothetical protein